MGMYESGELEEVMDSFEKSLQQESIYIGCAIEREEKEEIEQKGRIVKRYRNQNYYSNGNLNNLFKMFLQGYAAGKFTGRYS